MYQNKSCILTCLMLKLCILVSLVEKMNTYIKLSKKHIQCDIDKI